MSFHTQVGELSLLLVKMSCPYFLVGHSKVLIEALALYMPKLELEFKLATMNKFLPETKCVEMGSGWWMLAASTYLW